MVTVSWSLQRAEHGEQPVWAGVLLAALLGPDRAAGRRLRARLRLDGRQSGSPIHGVGAAHAAAAVATRCAPSIPVARIADMLLHPGEPYDYNGERRRYPYIELVYWSGGNPFHHHQDLARLRRALRRPDTVVVHEPYWTATARHADIVLPATMTLERDDIGARAQRPLPDRHAASHRAAVRRRPATTTHISRALADRLGVGRGVHRGPRRRRAGCAHLYEQWRAARLQRPSQAPTSTRSGQRGPWSCRAAPTPQVLFAEFRADPAAHPLGHAERAGSSCTPRPSPRSATTTAPATPPGSSRGSGTARPRAARYPLLLLANNPAAGCTASWTSARTAGAARSQGREPLRMHPADAAAPRDRRRRPRARLQRPRRLPRGRGARRPPAAGRGPDVHGRLVLTGRGPGRRRRCCARRGNVNVLTRDVGSSRLSPGLRGRPGARRGAALGGPGPGDREPPPSGVTGRPRLTHPPVAHAGHRNVRELRAVCVSHIRAGRAPTGVCPTRRPGPPGSRRPTRIAIPPVDRGRHAPCRPAGRTRSKSNFSR